MRKKTISQDEIISVLKTKYDAEYSPEKELLRCKTKLKNTNNKLKSLTQISKSLRTVLKILVLNPRKKSC